jgi:hypothetical protein
VPRSIISFGFEDSFEEGTTFRGLSKITLGCVEDFFLEVRVEAGTGIEAGTAARVFGTVRIAGSFCARHSKGST